MKDITKYADKVLQLAYAEATYRRGCIEGMTVAESESNWNHFCKLYDQLEEDLGFEILELVLKSDTYKNTVENHTYY